MMMMMMMMVMMMMIMIKYTVAVKIDNNFFGFLCLFSCCFWWMD